MRLATAAARSVLIATALAMSARSARAQSPRDSVSTDSVPARVGPHGAGMYLLIPIGMVAIAGFVFMPAAVALVNLGGAATARDLRPSAPLAVIGAVQVTGDTNVAGAHSFSVELLQRGVYAEIRRSTWRMAERFEYHSYRVGRVVRATDLFQGGVTIGYQHAPSDPTQDGVELGFPLTVIARAASIRLEPTYVVRSWRGSWNYRIRLDRRISRTPVYVGLDYEAKRIEEPAPFVDGLAVSLSWRP